jgi:hypothetical protein
MSFLIDLALKQNTSFLINIEHNKIMCLSVSMGDHAIFQEHKV